MRVVQLIDSLEAGGAERMAVNYANALADEIAFSALVTTRKEGTLKKQISDKTNYLFLNKRSTADIKAIFKLRNYLQKHNVQIIQAHSSSFFLAVLVKLSLPGVKIIWHDHYGNRIYETKKRHFVLFFSSFFFSACFAVNPELQKWILKNLNTVKVFFIPNFIVEDENIVDKTYLKGDVNKRIICLANLKKPKNHITILKAFNEAKLNNFSWSLHFVGKIYNDNYFFELKSFINENNLEKCVFLYDSQEDISFILEQGSVGVLASEYEGFPVCLLEYGNSGLATISADVGFCSSIIKKGYSGLLFNPNNVEELKEHFLKLAFNNDLRKNMGMSLKADVLKQYSCSKIIKKVIKKYYCITNE